MLIEIAKPRALPTAERMISDRHGNRNIDADHADIHTSSKITRGITIACENSDSVAVFMVRGKRQGVLIILRAHDR
jgi:hypothetical protein